MNPLVVYIDSLAAELINKLHIDANISAVTRLSKQSTRPRPIRIIFDSSKSVIDVLKSKRSRYQQFFYGVKFGLRQISHITK